jgi:hypothetical protein
MAEEEIEMMFDDEEMAEGVLNEKLSDAFNNPGFIAEFSPEEAEQAGAFVEDALSEQDALDSAIDLPGVLDQE